MGTLNVLLNAAIVVAHEKSGPPDGDKRLAYDQHTLRVLVKSTEIFLSLGKQSSITKLE